MAEKQNCSEIAVNASNGKRKPTIAALAKLIKAQCSYQRRSVATKSSRSGGGIKYFLLKALFAGSAVYLTTWLGIWGEPEQSTKIMCKIKRTLHKIDHEVTPNIIPDDMRDNILEKYERSKHFVRNQVENIPEELKAYYDKSEKYFTDLIKGKKP